MRPVVLIVEDDPHQRDVLRTFLLDKGFDVLATWNGEEGIQLARQEKPALVILDVGLPSISGLTVAEVLRASRETSHLPIVLISALDGMAAEAVTVGVRTFLSKPLDLAALGEEVARCIQPLMTA